MQASSGLGLWLDSGVSLAFGRHRAKNAFEAIPHLAVGQNQWYHFGVGAPPIVVYLVGIGMFTGGTGHLAFDLWQPTVLILHLGCA